MIMKSMPKKKSSSLTELHRKISFTSAVKQVNGPPGVDMSKADISGGQDDSLKGVIIINDVITKDSLAEASKTLLTYHLDKDFNDPIQIFLNSPGGHTDAGLAFLDLMAFVKNPIYTIGMGEIASMAVDIFVAGDRRILSPTCLCMIHHVVAGLWGSYPEIQADMVQLNRLTDIFIAHLLRNSKYKTIADLKKYVVKDQNNWLTPEEMKKHGLCDEILKLPERGKRLQQYNGKGRKV